MHKDFEIILGREMHHDFDLMLRLCIYKNYGTLTPVNSREKEPLSKASWREVWKEINKQLLEPSDDFSHDVLEMGNALRLHQQAFMEKCDSTLLPKTNTVTTSWQTHLAQIFSLVAYPWAWERATIDLGGGISEWTTESVHEALTSGTAFGRDMEDFLDLGMKQDADLKHVSIELGYPSQVAVPIPRHSVEPMHWNSLRVTDELRQGSMRGTDELRQGGMRGTDEIVRGIGHSRHSEDVAIEVMRESPAWSNQESARIKQEYEQPCIKDIDPYEHTVQPFKQHILSEVNRSPYSYRGIKGEPQVGCIGPDCVKKKNGRSFCGETGMTGVCEFLNHLRFAHSVNLSRSVWRWTCPFPKCTWSRYVPVHGQDLYSILHHHMHTDHGYETSQMSHPEKTKWEWLILAEVELCNDDGILYYHST